MKVNKIKFLTLVSSIIFLSSCDDRLEKVPFDTLAVENAFQTTKDYENGIRGIYLQLLDAGYYGSSDAGSMLSFPDVMSDNVIMTSNGRRTKQTLHEWVYSQDNITEGFYRNAYGPIYLANVVLNYIDVNNFQGTARANLQAEARALRAMAHFDLLRVYGKLPTQTGYTPASLGVPYNKSIDQNYTPTRDTVESNFQNILDDLLFAFDNINASNGIGRLNKESVALLLSRVYLYMGGAANYQKVIDFANLVTTPVAPIANVAGIWTDQNASGVLLRIANLPGAGNLNRQIGVTWGQGGVNSNVPEYAVRFEFMSLFSANDIRRSAYIQTITSTGGVQRNGIKKLFGKVGQFNGVVDFKILRTEEALLNKAEAQKMLNLDGPALTTLDQLRNQRYTSFSGGEAGNALLDAIKLERRLEFAFEYMRWFDLKRWNEPVVRQNTGDRIDGTGQPNPSGSLVLPANSNKWQWPFSTDMLIRNPNLVQNPQ
jgi:hypothetical protein